MGKSQGLTNNLFLYHIINMPSTFSYEWDTPAYKGKTSFNTGLFINGQFVDGSNKTTIEYVLDCLDLISSANIPSFSVVNPGMSGIRCSAST